MTAAAWWRPSGSGTRGDELVQDGSAAADTGRTPVARARRGAAPNEVATARMIPA